MIYDNTNRLLLEWLDSKLSKSEETQHFEKWCYAAESNFPAILDRWWFSSDVS